jgi:hypothetical protein
MRGRVIRIVDTHRIIINLGTADGVGRGDRFGIFTPSEEIVDPETEEILGSYRERKANVVARVVAERFSICAAPRQSFGQTFLRTLAGANPEQELPGSRPDPYQLPVELGQMRPLPTGSTIRVGDIVEPIAAPAEAEEEAEEPRALEDESPARGDDTPQSDDRS